MALVYTGGGSGSGGGSSATGQNATSIAGFNAGVGSNIIDGLTLDGKPAGRIIANIATTGDNYSVSVSGLSSEYSITPGSVVKKPDEQYTGGVAGILVNYAGLDDVKNPYDKKFLTGVDKAGGFSFNLEGDNYSVDIYKETWEYSDAYNQFENALRDAKTQKDKEWKISLLQDDGNANNGTEILSLKKTSGNWKIGISLSYFNEFGLDFSFKNRYSPTSNSVIIEEIYSGSSLDWMAGGVFYDSMKAGDVFFNATGDLNTVKFLGLESRNTKVDILNAPTKMPALYRTLGVDAGKSNESGGLSVSAKLYNSKIANSKALDIQRQKQDYGSAGEDSLTSSLNKNDSLQDFYDDVYSQYKNSAVDEVFGTISDLFK